MASNRTQAKKAAKKHPKLFAAVIIILVLIIIAVAVIWYLKPEVLEPVLSLIGTDKDNSEDGEGGDSDINIISGNEADIAEGDLSIHFLELGNKYAGDSILIKCGDNEVLIDAGSRQGSAATITEYVNRYCTDGTLEYVISTHADQDHIAGFYGDESGDTRTGILYQYKIGKFIKFDLTNKNTVIYNNYLSAVDYIAAQGTDVYTASECYEEKDGAHRQYYLDENETISINILYNYYYYNHSSYENNYSVVMLLTQELDDGNKYYLFTGDLEADGEKRLVKYYADVPAECRTEYNILPQVELYKAGHHGSGTSSSAELLNVIRPKYVAICCCAGSPEYTVTSLNTFPYQATIDRLALYTDKIYVTSVATDLGEVVDGKITGKSFGYTSMNGNIVFYYSGGELKLYCSNNDTILKDTEWFQTYRTWNS